MRNRFSRRDFITGLFGKKWSRDNLEEKTGFDNLARQADMHLDMEEYSEAIENLKKLTAKSPDHVQAKRKLGYCYLQTGELDKAISEFKSILDLREKDNFTLLYLGLCLCKKEQIHEAFYYWKKYFNVDQPHIQRRLNLYIGYYDNKMELTATELIREIEQAISEQRDLNTGGKIS